MRDTSTKQRMATRIARTSISTTSTITQALKLFIRALCRTIWSRMSSYANRIFSSDLDAFRSDGVIQTRSITFSGSVAGGATATRTATAFTLTNLDFYQVLFDNSVYSSGKWRDMELEGGTLVHETTTPSDLSAWFTPVISGNNLTITVTLFNPNAGSVTLQSTTINFRFVAYDSTLL